jgi:hypothetical protein
VKLDADGRQVLSDVPVPPMAEALREYAESDPQLALKGRLLE